MSVVVCTAMSDMWNHKMKIGCNALYAKAGTTSSVAMKNLIHAIYVFSLFLSNQLKDHSLVFRVFHIF